VINLDDSPAVLRFGIENKEIVSNSEAGHERAYQGTCTLVWWEVTLEPRQNWEIELRFGLRPGSLSPLQIRPFGSN